MIRRCILLHVLVSLISAPRLYSGTTGNPARKNNKVSSRQIRSEFKFMSNEISRRNPGVKILFPVRIPQPGRANGSNRKVPIRPVKAASKVFAYVAKNYELRSKTETAVTRGTGIVDVKKGQRVEVILMLRRPVDDQADKSFRWCLVRTDDDEEGYIPNYFLRADKKPDKYIVKKGYKFVKPRMGVAMRKQPKKLGSLIQRLPFRAEVKVIRFSRKKLRVDGKTGRWAFVRYGHAQGWVFNGFLLNKKPARPLIKISNDPFVMPVNGTRTSNYGPRVNPFTRRSMQFHSGIDISAPLGTPILAALSGRVAFAGWRGGYGKLIILVHDNGLSTYYGHQSRFTVGVGARVNRGQVIGYVGSSGHSTGPHLHFEIRTGGTTKNPDDFFTK